MLRNRWIFRFQLKDRVPDLQAVSPWVFWLRNLLAPKPSRNLWWSQFSKRTSTILSCKMPYYRSLHDHWTNISIHKDSFLDHHAPALPWRLLLAGMSLVLLPLEFHCAKGAAASRAEDLVGWALGSSRSGGWRWQQHRCRRAKTLRGWSLKKWLAAWGRKSNYD